MVNRLPKNSVWSIGGLGHFQLPINTVSIVAGRHIRVGIEDSIHYDYNQTKLDSNVDLVKRIIRIATKLQRPIYTTQEFCSAFNISKAYC